MGGRSSPSEDPMPIVKKHLARKAGLRDQILQTALHLYSTRGYFRTSIHDIQQAAGVSMGSIYNHFGGKEAVAQALYDDLLQRMEDLVDDIAAQHETLAERGRATTLALFTLTETEPETIAYILNARHREFLTDAPPICSSRAFIKLRDLIYTGMERGEIPQMNPWIAASQTFGAALRMISLRLDGLIEEPITPLADEVWEVAWRGLGGD